MLIVAAAEKKLIPKNSHSEAKMKSDAGGWRREGGLNMFLQNTHTHKIAHTRAHILNKLSFAPFSSVFCWR